MSSNLPPGCNSDDGGIDHELESATEELCYQITDPAVARALTRLGPDRIANAATHAEGMGYDGVRALEALPELINAAQRVLGKLNHPIAPVTILDEDALRGALAQARKED